MFANVVEKSCERREADDVEALESFDPELYPDDRGEQRGDEDGARRDSKDPSSEGHLRDQPPDLFAVVA